VGAKSAVEVNGEMLVDEVMSEFELRGLGYRADSTSGIIALAPGFGRTGIGSTHKYILHGTATRQILGTAPAVP